MKKFSDQYAYLLYEALEDKVADKISTDYLSLKKGILDLIENSLDSTEELVAVQNFIHDYIEAPTNGTLIDFVEDNDIFDFYLKFQADVDQVCNNNGFFEKTPQENNLFGLYDIMIEGTRFAVLQIMKILEKEIF